MINTQQRVCGVLLTDHGWSELGGAIAPYLREGPIGKYIYCTQAVQNGSFMDMTFDPRQTDGSVSTAMVVSIPVQFVKFMATGANTLGMGFTQSA